MSRAKAWQAELDPEEMPTGCPSPKKDGTPFDENYFTKCVKEMRPLASKLPEETDLSKYQAAYTMENSKVKASAYEIVDLIPPIRKHTFAPDIDPSTLIDDEAVFKALTGIDWTSPDFQTMHEEEELAQDNPEASTHQDQNN